MKQKKIDEANLAAMAAIAQTAAEIEADGIESDQDVPGRLRLLARRAMESTDEKITAIKRYREKNIVPEMPIATATERIQWSLARLSGKPIAPAAKIIERDWWYFIVRGNPIMVESWLKDEGYSDAFAGSPNSCRVMLAD